jgi:hypothetical protein
LELIGDEITEENDRFCSEPLDALAEGEEVDRR